MLINMLKSLLGGLIDFLLYPIRAIINLFKKKPELPDPMPEPIPIVPPDKDYEKIYNNKYPKVDIVHYGRPVPGGNIGSPKIPVDVRDFFNVYDSQIKRVVESLNIYDSPTDIKVLACLLWVIDHIRYKIDLKNQYLPPTADNMTEYWQFGYETLYLKTGDCEDSAILLANMLLIAGIPYWKVRLTAGMVDDGRTKGGHCFVTFFDEPLERWVLLDTTFYPNRLPIYGRKEYKDETYYKETWFSWNLKFSFAKDVRMITNMKGMEL